MAATLGNASGVQGASSGLRCSASSAKSHPPAQREAILRGTVDPTVLGCPLQSMIVVQEFRIALQEFPGKAGCVERPLTVIRTG
jgi:hypothetical protein